MTDLGMRGPSSVGFIGVGNMGEPMVANLVRGGFEVTVFDVDSARAERVARTHGARHAPDLAALGTSADVVITMLPTGREVRHALMDMEDGACIRHLRPDAIVIDMSSADPVGTRALGADLARDGVRLVDAPVSGGVPRAMDGTLAIMIGGDPVAVAAVKPVLACLGQKLFEVGSLGCGHATKSLNNFLAATSLAAAAEAVRVGRRFGLNPAVMTDVINASTGRSFATEMLIKQHVLSGAFATGFTAALLAKDVGIAADLGTQIGVHAPVAQLISRLWIEAAAALEAGADHTRAATAWDGDRTDPPAPASATSRENHQGRVNTITINPTGGKP